MGERIRLIGPRLARCATFVILRCFTCGSSNAWPMSFTGPHGSPAAFSISTRSEVVNRTTTSATSLRIASLFSAREQGRGVLGPFQEILRAQRLTEHLPVVLLAGGDVDQSVRRLERPHGHGCGVVVALLARNLPIHRVSRALEVQCAQHGLEQGGMHPLAARSSRAQAAPAGCPGPACSPRSYPRWQFLHESALVSSFTVTDINPLLPWTI